MSMSIAVSAITVGLLLQTTFGGEPELVGRASVSGMTLDRSGLTGDVAPGLPQSLLGGLSAIHYTGKGNRYCALSDRGPRDGAVPYACRVQFLEIRVSGDQSGGLDVSLESTALLRDARGTALTGAADAFGAGSKRRFDPEGLAVNSEGNLFVSEEYGPSIVEFDNVGNWVHELTVPARFRIAHPSASRDAEAAGNQTGRQPNRGLEGLTLTPSGRKLIAVMQGPLIQDSRPSSNGKRSGINTRVLEVDVQTGTTREFLYPLDDSRNGVSEILAINENEFLLIERDGESGSEAKFKKIIHASVAHASDISQLDSLPANQLPDGVKPMSKRVFIDLLNAEYGLAGTDLPEKFEGLAFGPTLPDGRRLLLLSVDNDFEVDQPNWVYAFAVENDDLPTFKWKF